ncbi:hypothetical protein ETC03_06515 [Geobacillus sp. MMMUD3]|nr:hypothetical protein [Geobacillus sp. MMMUD3]
MIESAALEEDLFTHIHLENNVLFPRVLAAVKQGHSPISKAKAGAAIDEQAALRWKERPCFFVTRRYTTFQFSPVVSPFLPSVLPNSGLSAGSKPR